MPKHKPVVLSVHKALPECCRATLIKFAITDPYAGAGETGDQIRCGCGNTLIYDYRGWRIKDE